MKPLEILMEEHRLIRQSLENLSLTIERLESGERPPVEFFEKWIEFYRTLVLNYHHFKEEYVMFQRLAEKNKGTLDSQIESLRYQHERGRNYISEATNSLKGYDKGEEIQTSILLENLAAYVSLIRHHIHREEDFFYPIVEKELTEEEQKALLEEFRKEEDKANGKVLENSRKLLQEMGTLLVK